MATRWLRKMTPEVGWRSFTLDTLFLVFFSAPVVFLYIFVPSTFEVAWKGRVPYVIFVWLVLLEFFSSRAEISESSIDAEPTQLNVRAISGFVALSVPTFFALWEYTAGGSELVVLLGRLVGAPFPELEWDWPLAFECLLFAFFFALSVLLLQKRNGLKRFRVSLSFISVTAAFFMIDAFYHGGTVWFLQLLVPSIVSLTVLFFNILGYQTAASIYGDGYMLAVNKTGGYAMNLMVYWPCAGVSSVITYTIVVLLFFKDIKISSKRKIVYVLVGAAGTLMANILRIVNIGIIGAETGPDAAELFHKYYGELFFVIWIVLYLMVVLIIESQVRAHNGDSTLKT